MLRAGHGGQRTGPGHDRPPVVRRRRLYRYAVEEDLLEHSPAAHVRRPRLDYESHMVGLDRNEVGALLVAAGLGTAVEHALSSLLAINGLRISEALGADVDDLGLERGHRTLTVLRKGGKLVTIPLAPRTARAIDLAIGERLAGPIFLRADGQRGSAMLVAVTGWGTEEDKRRTREAGFDHHLTKPVSVDMLHEILAPLEAGG